MKKQLITFLFCGVAALVRAALPVVFGEPLPDTNGVHVNAHGGNIIAVGDTFYWYGEDRGNGTPGSGQDGVACYTATDLRHWTNRGIVLAVSDSTGHPLERGGIIERPKVLFCPNTGKYVMWFHHELKGRGYGAAHAAVAVADNPLGPFTLLHSGRVNPGIYPENMAPADCERAYPADLEWWTPQWYKEIEQGMFAVRDFEGGQMARDQTVYVDTDGTAYHIYSSEDNLTLQIAELDPTYTRHTGRYIRIFPGGHNEAPAIFRHGGKYWMIASGCTGWDPNEARLMWADSIMGQWHKLPNPCRGENAAKTFNGQSTYIMEYPEGEFTFMADIWNPSNLADSRHIWLPISFDADGVPYIEAPR